MNKIIQFETFYKKLSRSKISKIKDISTDTGELYQTNIFNRFFIDEALMSATKDRFIPKGHKYSTYRNKMLTFFYNNRDEDFLSRSLKGDEAETIATYIEPVIEALGWSSDEGKSYTREASIPKIKNGKKSNEKLDVAILKDTACVKDFKNLQKRKNCKNEDLFKILKEDIVTIVEAKTIGSLYKTADEKPRKKNANSSGEDAPNRQTYSYIQDLGIEYGILSDGRYWRYIPSKYEMNDNKYFQVDLNAIFQMCLAEIKASKKSLGECLKEGLSVECEYALIFFYNFFSKDALDSKNTVFNYLVEHNNTFFKHLEDKLKYRFVLAMTHLANGFVEELKHAGEDPSEYKDIIRTTSESFLFNIMFIRSLEMKGILPYFSDKKYKENISISYIVEDVLYKNNKKFDKSDNTDLFDVLENEGGLGEAGPDAYTINSRIGKAIQTIVRGKNFGFKEFEESILTEGERKFCTTYQPKDRYYLNALFFLCFVPVSEVKEKDKLFQLIPYETLTPREIGSLYESFLEYDLQVVKSGSEYWDFSKNDWKVKKKSTEAKEREIVRTGYFKFSSQKILANNKRKKDGSFYTPQFIVRFIVNKTLGPLVENKSPDEITKIKVCDPAMGSGHFLGTALDFLTDAYIERLDDYVQYEVAARKILDSCIFGVDINESAVKLAKMTLWLKTANREDKLENLEDQLVCKNSLVPPENLGDFPGVNWEPMNLATDFGKRKEISFDAIIGNPPWGAELTNSERKALARMYPKVSKGCTNSFKFFVQRSFELMAEDGRFGFIIPNTFLIQPKYKDLQAYFLEKKNETTINLGDGIFGPDVNAPCAIVIAVNEKADQKKLSLIDLSQVPVAEKEKSLFGKNVKAKISLSVVSEDFVPFSHYIEAKDCGIKHQRNGCGLENKGKSDLAERLYYEGKKKNKDDIKYVIGRDLDRSGFFINTNNPRYFVGNYKKILKKNETVYFNENIMKTPKKLVWRQTADRPICGILGKKHFGNTLQAGLLTDEAKKEGVTLEYLCSILNSNWFRYLYLKKVMEKGRVFPQVKLTYLREMPVPKATAKSVNEITNLYDKYVETKSPVYLQEINSKVYELYGVSSNQVKEAEELVTLSRKELKKAV